MVEKEPVLLIIFFVVQGIFFVGMYPLWEGSDEHVHFAYVQYIAENKKMPTVNDTISQEIGFSIKKLGISNQYTPTLEDYKNFWTNFDADEVRKNKELASSLPVSMRTSPHEWYPIYEAQLPPLAYLVQVPIYNMFYDQDILVRAYALRVFSVLVTMVAIVFAYKTISLLFDDRLMRVGSLMFIVFFPQFTVNVSRVNNEMITILLFSIFLYLMVRYLKEKTNTLHVVLIGLVLGLGLLAKQTFVAAFILVPIFIFLKHIQNKSTQPKITLVDSLKNLAIVFGITIPMVSWWYYERFATGNFSGEWHLRGITIEEYSQGFFDFSWWTYYQSFFKYFWGWYGWSFLTPPSPYFEVIMIFVVICIVGLVYGIVKKTKTHGFRIFRNWKYQSIFALSLSSLLIIISQSLISVQMFYLLGGIGINVGWYIFITITAISMLILLGFRTLIINSKLKNFQNESLLVAFVILVIFNATTFYWLLPKYYAGV